MGKKSLGNTNIIPDGKGLTFEKVWLMFKETDRQFKETDKKFAETRQEIRELSRNIGGLNNALGDIIEAFVQGGIANELAKEGVKNIDVRNNLEVHDKGESAEIDCLVFGELERKKVAFICECKNHMKKDDVERIKTRIHHIIYLLKHDYLTKHIVDNKTLFYIILGYAKIDDEAKVFSKSIEGLLRYKVGGNGTLKKD